MMIGKGKIIKNKGIFKFNFTVEHDNNLNSHAIARACDDMAKTKTGAIMVITQMDDLAVFTESGVEMNAEISVPMIESIFYKNSPLHDGATIIRDNYIVATRVILPISSSTTIPARFGLRHRAAIGLSQETDAMVIVVSEETGNISVAREGRLATKIEPFQLRERLGGILQDTSSGT